MKTDIKRDLERASIKSLKLKQKKMMSKKAAAEKSNQMEFELVMGQKPETN